MGINGLREDGGGVTVREGEGEVDHEPPDGFSSLSKHSSQTQASAEPGFAAHGRLEVQKEGHSSSQ